MNIYTDVNCDLVSEIEAFCLSHYEQGYNTCVDLWDTE